jgi:hypothetical protein
MSTYCTYCGSTATDRDHVIPVSLTTCYTKRYGDVAVTVPACRECNAILGNRLFKTFEARAAYVASRLKARYKKLLAAPSWTDEELAELGPSLRSSIIANAGAKVEARRRIEFAGRQAA